MDYKRYQHVERLGTTETEGILEGRCYIFPKLDGMNASVWIDDDGYVCCASRNRQLDKSDPTGFYQYVQDNVEKFEQYFQDNYHHRLYGEYLIPHSLRTYRSDAWGEFYVFDVMTSEDVFIEYSKYFYDVMGCDIKCVPALAVVMNPTQETLNKAVEQNTYLIEDNKGSGEGIVIKNYNYQNRRGKVIWAKIVKNEFKDKHLMENKTKIINSTIPVEQRIIDKFVTLTFADKEYRRIITGAGGWESKYIPMLLNTVYYCLIKEEMWDIVKTFKNLTVDFSVLKRLCDRKVRELLPNIF